MITVTSNTIITPLVFNVGKTQHLVQDGKVNLPSLQHLLSFRFIPAYPHSRLQTPSGHFVLSIVYSFYTFLQPHILLSEKLLSTSPFLAPTSDRVCRTPFTLR